MKPSFCGHSFCDFYFKCVCALLAVLCDCLSISQVLLFLRNSQVVKFCHLMVLVMVLLSKILYCRITETSDKLVMKLVVSEQRV